ncbi:MAG TPA: nucleotidyltransferase family protein [Anaerolineae bacterium]|nr:nucleotidyltransferase family protein [Anaerolineae bacterium]
MQRDPTAALLLALCNGDPGPAAQAHIAGLLAQPLDWTRLSELAALHGVVGLVRHNLGALEAASRVPEPSWRAMEQAAAQTAFDGMVHLRQLAGVVAALCSAGVEPLLLKGYALADLVYPDPVTRPSHDLDVLVRPDQVMPACQALAQIGCTLPDQATAGVQLANAYDLSVTMPPMAGLATLLDLHWDLAPRGLFALDLDLWRARSEVFDLAGQPARRFSPEDMLLHLALHMRKHRYIGLRWLCDVAELLRRFAGPAAPRPLDWQYVVGAARAARLTVLLYTCLTLAQRLLHAPVDPALLARLEPAAWRRKLLQSVLSQQALLAPLEREDAGWTRLAPVEILLIDRPSAMARELSYRLLPPPEAVLGAEALGMSRGQRRAFQVRRLLDRSATIVE